MAFIEIENLSFSYDGQKKVLNDISLSLDEGKYISVIGHNGSGKSTLAKLIVGLLETRTGTIKLFNNVLNEKTLHLIRPRVGIIFQNPDNQFIGATVADDIAFGLENRRVPHEQMQSIIDEFASKVKMEKFLDKEPGNLSGGQKQRVAIASVLAMNPDIVIMDEATAMLDPKGKREIREITLKMKQENPHLTIISITHDIEEAFNSDEIIVLNEGKVALRGTPKEVFAKKSLLIQIGLDLPFVLRFNEALLEAGIKVTKSDTFEELVRNLCQ